MIARAATLSLPLALALAASFVPTEAEAAPPNPTLTDKKVRVHFGTDLFGFTHFNPEFDPAPDVNTLGFGIGRHTGIGRLPPDAITLGAGGVILGGRAVVGANAVFVVDGMLIEDGDDFTTVGGKLIPYFRWMFGPFGRWRPFVGVRVGFGGQATTGEDDMTGERTTNHVIYPLVGIEGGAHAFITDSVSVDLGITFDYAAPHVRGDSDLNEDDEFDKAGDAINLGIIVVGLSAWF